MLEALQEITSKLTSRAGNLQVFVIFSSKTIKYDNFVTLKFIVLC
jgi:hypothetical protein